MLLIFYLSLIFVGLISVCLVVLLLGFILPGTLCASWTWLTISFPMFGKFSGIISSNIFSGPFSLLLLGPQHNVNIGAFNVVPEEFVCMSSSLEKHLFRFSNEIVSRY